MSRVGRNHALDVAVDTRTGAGTNAPNGVDAADGPVAQVSDDRAGGPLAQAIDPTEYADHFRQAYDTAPYYSSGRQWRDYEPAYRYGYDTYPRYAGRRFDEAADVLEGGWDAARAESRLTWAEASAAVRDGWHLIGLRSPGEMARTGSY